MKPTRSRTCYPAVGSFLFLLAAWALCPAAGGETLEQVLAYPTPSTTTDATGRWAQVDLPGAETEVPFGAPAVPSVRVKLALPEGLSVEAVRWEIEEQQTLALPRPLQPYAGAQASIQAEPPTIAPDPVIYGSSGLYPPEPVQLIDTVELSNGARFAVVRIYPVRVRPATNEISWVKRGRLVLTLSARSVPGHLLRLRAALPGSDGGGGAPSGPGRVLLAEHGFAPTEIPSIEGSPIVYAIICPPDDAMASAWQALADWKTACGYPAAVFRTDWIDTTYPAGSDQPERIRAFLRDAYLHWGLRWALIGADATLIPNRYARSWAFVPTENGTDVATDYYYACLEGNWDADGDGIFGESDRFVWNIGDKADLTPEIDVGRVSARSAAEVNDFLAKYFVYARTPALDGYLDRILLLAEVLFNAEWTRTSNNGRFDCQETDCDLIHCRRTSGGNPICVTYDGAAQALATGDQLRDLGASFERHYLLERYEHWDTLRTDLDPDPELESTSSVIEHLNQGFSFVHHVGHGDRDRWAVGEGRLELGQLAGLVNGNDNHFFWAYGINCNSAAIDFDSFGERMVMLPGQGAIAYLGCTNADFPSTARIFSEDFYSSLFSTPGTTLGDGHFGAMWANAPGPQEIDEESIKRFMLCTQILLGDPGMPVWRGTPTALTAQLVDFSNRQVPLGRTSLTVLVTAGTLASPVEGARVCIQKAGELYAVALTGSTGRVDVPFWPETQGAFVVTVSAADHLETALNGTVVAATSGPALVLDALGLVDDGTDGSQGNGNGRIEVGETVRVRLTVANAGVATANAVVATLVLGGDAPAGCVTVTDDSAAIASIPAGDSGSDDQAFLLAYAVDPPEEAFGEADLIRIPFRMTLSSASGSAALDLYLDLARPRLGVSINRLDETGTPRVKKLWVGVQNEGQGAASHLLGKLTSVDSHHILVQSPPVAGHDIAPGDTALVGPFQIRVLPGGDAGQLLFDLFNTAPDPDDTLHHRLVDVQAPGIPDSLTLTGLRAGMHLKWKAPVDPGGGAILGYRVYRTAGTGTPPFPDVVGDILEGHRVFTDVGLSELSRYSYYVAGVDAGGNLGSRSLVQSAYTAPGASPGWPHMTEDITKASPLICELDGATTRGREILFSAEYVYAFHGDGGEVNDGDRLERTSGPFGVPGPDHQVHPFWAKPAAGDLDGDGTVEVVAISFPGNDQTKRGELFCWSTWGGSPQWAVTFPEWWRSWNSPVLADLNDDGKLEILFCGGRGNHGGIYVYNHDGTPWGDPQKRGLLRDLGGMDLYQSPAVGDVDGDGAPEIVLATRTSVEADGALWVLETNGDPTSGFNNLKFSSLVSPQGLAQITTASPTLCNVDGSPGDEIFVVTTKRLWCFSKRGAPALWYVPFSGQFNLTTYELLPEPALGDVDGDGKIDIALVDPSGKLLLIQASTGLSVWSSPVQLDATARYGSCILANVDRDARPEIIFGDSKQHVYAYRYDRELAAGFPINSGGDMVRQSLAAWDVDLDGYQNLVIQAFGQQQLSVLHMSGVAFPTNATDILRQNPWPMRRRDARNTGRYTTETPVLVQLVIESPQISETGEVRLTWTASEPVSAFRILRAGGGGNPMLVGEVPGRPGEGSQRYTFLDTPPEAGTYVYRVNPVLLDGEETSGPVIEVTVGAGLPIRTGLQRVAPDPLTPGRVAAITFGIPGTASSQVRARLDVFDVQGRRVRALMDEPRPAGVHVVSWDGRDNAGRPLATGLYLLRLEARGFRSERRLLVLR